MYASQWVIDNICHFPEEEWSFEQIFKNHNTFKKKVVQCFIFIF